VTTLRHHDGTISTARDGPDTAQDEFFICIGDQPELISAGNATWRPGFAVGQVIRAWRRASLQKRPQRSKHPAHPIKAIRTR
jgi:peptidyl-prolyl cis-trans isomerase A (cyclophilin A)